MLLMKYLLLTIGWGLLGWAAAIALNNLNKIVQYHRQARIHIAPEPGSPARASRDGVEGYWRANPQRGCTPPTGPSLGAAHPIILALGVPVLYAGSERTTF